MSTKKELTPSLLIELHVRKNLSLTKIGEMYNVSRQRVHQIKKEYEKKHGKINRRMNIDALTLKHFLELGWNATQIANHFNMSPSKVSRLIRNYKSQYEIGKINVHIKRKTSEDILPKNELIKLYINDLLTDREIANLYNLSPSTVNLLRKRYKINSIQTKKLRRLPQLLTKDKFDVLYYKEGHTLQEIADMFSCNISSILKLKETYFKYK